MNADARLGECVQSRPLGSSVSELEGAVLGVDDKLVDCPSRVVPSAEVIPCAQPHILTQIANTRNYKAHADRSAPAHGGTRLTQAAHAGGSRRRLTQAAHTDDSCRRLTQAAHIDDSRRRLTQTTHADGSRRRLHMCRVDTRVKTRVKTRVNTRRAHGTEGQDMAWQGGGRAAADPGNGEGRRPCTYVFLRGSLILPTKSTVVCSRARPSRRA